MAANEPAAAGRAEGKPLFQALAGASPDAVVVATPAGAVTFINAAGLALMGFGSLEEAAHRRWAELWPEEHRGEVVRAQLQACAGQTARFRTFLIRPDGLTRWFDTVVTPVLENGEITALLAISTRRDARDRDPVLPRQHHRVRSGRHLRQGRPHRPLRDGEPRGGGLRRPVARGPDRPHHRGGLPARTGAIHQRPSSRGDRLGTGHDLRDARSNTMGGGATSACA